MYGPPDEIESHPSGGTYERPMKKAAAPPPPIPFEQWRYRYIEGIGNQHQHRIRRSRPCRANIHMTMDPSEKDALLYVPGAGLTMIEQMGMADKTQRFQRTDGTHLGSRSAAQPDSMNEFTRLEQFAKLQKPPADQVQGSGSGGQFDHQVQPAADEGARGLLPGHRSRC